LSFRSAAKLVVVACATLGLAMGAIGCLSDDTSLTLTPKDSGVFDGSLTPIFDASGTVDGSNLPPADAAPDAPGADSAPPPPVDAGKDAAGPSQAGLVAGGAVGHSPSYKMTGTTGPATAPVLKSPSYQLVGGMAVTGFPDGGTP
jgi:hypothetical protein